MKAFFSQTWVVALMVAIVIGLICWAVFRKKAKDDADATALEDKKPADQE